MLPTEKQWESIRDSVKSIDEPNRKGTSVADLFAIGCYLSLIGETKAGRKAVDTALLAIDLDKNNKSLFIKIMDNIKGNEGEFSKQIWAHAEINDLFINKS